MVTVTDGPERLEALAAIATDVRSVGHVDELLMVAGDQFTVTATLAPTED